MVAPSFTSDKEWGICDCPRCLSVCLYARILKTRAWIWIKFCVSTGVGTSTNWSTFEPDPDHSPDAGTEKSEIESRSNRHLTQSRLQVTGCTVERYCLLHVVVQGPGSFRGRLNFFVRHTVADLRGVTLAQFSDFGLCRRYMRSTF